VIGANMGCKIFVAPQLEVAHHFIERCAGGSTNRFKPPVTQNPKTDTGESRVILGRTVLERRKDDAEESSYGRADRVGAAASGSGSRPVHRVAGSTGPHGKTRLVPRTESGFKKCLAGGRIKTSKVSKSVLAAPACSVLRQAIAALPPARLFGADATLKVCFRYHSYVRAMPLSSGI